MRRRLLLVGALALSLAGAAATWPDLAIPAPAWAAVGDAELWARDMAPGKPLAVGVKRYAAPPEYAAWWARLEACAGLRADLGRVRWHEARFITMALDDSSAAEIIWMEIFGFVDAHADSSDFYLTAPDSGAPPSRMWIEHEMLHELLFRNGVTDSTGGHPRPPYGKCAVR